MGKNKKNKKSNAKDEAQSHEHHHHQQHSHEHGCGCDHDHDHHHENEHFHEEDKRTPEERAREYRESSFAAHERFAKRFEEEIDELINFSHLEERKLEQIKINEVELEKMRKHYKKVRNDMENLTGTGATNFKGVKDKIMSDCYNQITKISGLMTKQQLERAQYQSSIKEYQEKMNKLLNQKKIFCLLCESLLKQNADLYLNHELMLEGEKVERSKIAQSFQDKMIKINEELQDNKEKRRVAIEKNEEIRKKINEAIEEYKKKEQDYKDKLNTHNSEIQKIQDKFQNQLKDGSIGKVLKECEQSKDLFERVNNNVKRLTEDIQNIIKKFDDVKDEIGERSQKFEHYKMEIENKKLQVQLLETEIQNITLKAQNRDKIKEQVELEKA